MTQPDRQGAVPGAPHVPDEHAPSSYRYINGCRHPACRAAHARIVAETRERAALRAAADPSIIPHGTGGGYEYWGCRCMPCSEAKRLAKVARRALRKTRLGQRLTGFEREILLGGAA